MAKLVCLTRTQHNTFWHGSLIKFEVVDPTELESCRNRFAKSYCNIEPLIPWRPPKRLIYARLQT